MTIFFIKRWIDRWRSILRKVPFASKKWERAYKHLRILSRELRNRNAGFINGK